MDCFEHGKHAKTRWGDRRRTHSVLPQQHRVCRHRQLRHVGQSARRAGRALRPARRRAGRSRVGRGDQAFVRLEPRARGDAARSGLAPTTPGITTARACGTSLDNTIIVANKIAAGQIEAGIAGGSDTTSDVPIVYGARLRKRLLAMNRAKTPLDKLKAARARIFASAN